MMTIRAKLTPEVLLSAPRRSAGSPNSSGKLALYTVSELSLSSICRARRREIQQTQGNATKWDESTPQLTRHQVSTYSFQEHKKSNSIQVLDLGSNHATTLYTDASYSEPTWLSETEFLVIKSGDKGTSSLLVADVSSPGASSVSHL